MGFQSGSLSSPAQAGRGGQPLTGAPGQPGAMGAGPIIGVVSRSTGEAMRLYNGYSKYNEWLFMSTAATQQAGAPVGSPQPGAPGAGPAGRGRGPQQALPGRGGRGREGMPPGGRGPGGFQPSPFGPAGRPGGPGAGGPSNPFTPGRGRL